MIEFTLEQAAAACGGRFYGDARLLERALKSVVIDSRKAEAGSLFVPVRGEKLDGHDFIPAARGNGALCVLTERPLPEEPYILVEDGLDALQALAAYERSLFRGIVAGLTGSAGKTTTKELTAAVLAQRFSVCKTAGNLNNQTGVPQTLFSLAPQHGAAVVEMGTNHFGEIDRLARMVRPDIALLTNVGTAHLEFFGSRDGIFRAKTELLAHLAPGATVIFNGDDDKLMALSARKDLHSIPCGMGAHNAVRAIGVREVPECVDFTLCYGDAAFPVHLPAPGRFMVTNALLAAGAGFAAGLTPEGILRGLESYVPLGGRMAVEKLGGVTLLNDVYNANPTSMTESVRVLAGYPGRRVCILGDMYELGEKSGEYHRGVGETAARLGIERVIGVGELGALIAEAAGGKPYATQEALIAALPALLCAGDTVLVKASRGMHLERTAEAIRALYAH